MTRLLNLAHPPRWSRSILIVVALTTMVWGTLLSPGAAAANSARSSRPVRARLDRGLTFDERVEAQRAIEQVYWSHRVWPEQNPKPKPRLQAVMPDAALRAKVEDSLRKSNALEAIWSRPVTAEQLQGEMDRMAKHTRDRHLLGELFAALGNDPTVIAETLVRSSLVDRLVRTSYAAGSGVTGEPKPTFDSWWAARREAVQARIPAASAPFTLAAIDATGCTFDTWAPTSTGMDDPAGRHYQAAVWTGAEMIVWGGRADSTYFSTGGRYDPATDAWVATSTGAGVPAERQRATGVWTGTEMIVWGGFNDATGFLNSGGRYNPATDTWLSTSTGANLPEARSRHIAVWTGTEMVVWGGFYHADSFFYPSTGGRYDPATDTWAATSTGANVPDGRAAPTAVWTGTEMVVWGGEHEGPPVFNTGGRYDPSTDTWTPTSLVANVPGPRSGHTAVWTGSEMIVWGGDGGGGGNGPFLQTGGRYDPSTDAWLPTSTGANVPDARFLTASVWTGTEMIVWGGYGSTYSDTGGRYDPAADTWTPTSTGANLPDARFYHTAVWTGTEMIVWSGISGDGYVNTGGRYCTCVAPVVVYRDADGDGYGDAAGSIGRCGGSIPAGYVADDTDCDDTSGAVHPGASDACNGIDDDCDGSLDDGEAGLCNDGNACTDDACAGAAGCVHSDNSAACNDGNACTTGDTCSSGSCAPGAPNPAPSEVESVVLNGEVSTTLTWAGMGGGVVFDIEWSTLSDLRSAGTATATCLANDVAGASYLDDGGNPPADDGYYYLIRAQSACGSGSYGVDGTGGGRAPAPSCP